jgi:Zn-dependent protease/CBS domain-containing protein
MRLGRIFGIEITVHVTWLFVFALVAWSLSSGLGPFVQLRLSEGERIGLAIFSALLFFASVLIHELAHSILARSQGIRVRGIMLFIFGGVSQFEEEARTAPVAAWVSAIGPLTSLALGALFFGLTKLFTFGTPLGTAFGYLAFANVLLAIFNLVPAYPLDGGRVLQALVWRASGDSYRATRSAIIVGRIFAWAMIAFGITETLVGSVTSGLWLTFIGWFLLQAGTAEGLQVEVKQVLGGHSVGELATQGNPISADTTAEGALQTMLRTGGRALPVMLGESLLGIVSLDDIGKVPPEELGRTYVTAIMTRESELKSVSPETPATEALQLLARSGHDQLPVVARGGQLVGFITQESILRWVAAHRHLQRVRDAPPSAYG